MKHFKFFLALSILLFFVFLNFSGVFALTPTGANLTEYGNQTSQADPAKTISAQAGNVTEVNLFGYSVTQSWQGYFGNVSGVIQLADNNDDVMYNWSLASPEGEVYASVGNSIDWGNVDCFNWTANGTDLESNYSIKPDDVDGVNETFKYNNGHDVFYTNSKMFSGGECMSAQMFDGNGKSEDNFFEEVLLTDGNDVIFTSLLEEADVTGFDGRAHDFEMMVLEDGHNTNVEVTPYYFYVELQ